MQLTRWPLWLQLTSAMVAASILVAVVAGQVMRVIETDFLRDELRRESLRTSEALTENLARPVAEGDARELGVVLQRTRRDNASIHSVALIDAAGRTVSRWVGGGEVSPGEVFYFSIPTRIPGTGQGQLVVSWNVAGLLRNIERHVDRLRLNVFLIVGLLSGLLVVLMHFLVMRPVDALRRGLDALSRGGAQARPRLPVFAASELVRLAASLGELGRHQLELRETQASLEEARNRAEVASEAKGRFLAVMSHEIRTPINGVVGSLELLGDGGLNPTQRSLLNNAIRSADSLLEIINEILDFSRVESGRVQLEQVDFQLEAQVNDVASSISGLVDPGRVELVVDFDPALPERICGDPLRLRQVLTNLLGNAVKFTEAGTVMLRARRGDGDRLHLEVRDTGIGIPPEQQANLFQPFTQADSSTTRRYGGTGLGLSIVKQLVELMGGTIDLESTPGAGSNFRVDLPLDSREPPRRIDAGSLAGARALLVEDNPFAAEALTGYLRSFGLQVAAAAEAVGAVAEARGTPYLILDAGVVNDSGGAAFIHALRAAVSDADTHVVLLVPPGVPVPDAARIDAVVLKPVKRGELITALMEPRADEVAAGPRDGVAAAAGKGVVLLVDDNPMNLQVAAALLERLGLETDTAASGDEALSRLADRRYDVVLMDEQMPGMDGLEATRRLREREGGNCRTPVVALTANTDTAAERRCLEAGMDAFIAKPVRRKALRSVLSRWLTDLPVADEGGA